MSGSPTVPDNAAIVSDLQELRRRGLKSLRDRRYSSLGALGRQYQGQQAADDEGTTVETMLRLAIERLGKGPLGEAARLTFGFAAGTRGMPSAARRRQAAAVYDLQPESFRKQPEHDLLTEVARELRQLALGQPDQVAAVQQPIPGVDWVERFEWYYRLWAPISGLRNDLDAALQLRNQADDEWDDYASYALVHLTRFSLVLHRFIDAHGGMWLLGDPATEDAVSEAVYQIGLNTPLSERDESWLRTQFTALAEPELHPFLRALEDSDTGRALLGEWRDWLDRCQCSAEVPTRACHVHAVIMNCDLYLAAIDQQWRKQTGRQA